jgi:hypothetical protein
VQSTGATSSERRNAKLEARGPTENGFLSQNRFPPPARDGEATGSGRKAGGRHMDIWIWSYRLPVTGHASRNLLEAASGQHKSSGALRGGGKVRLNLVGVGSGEAKAKCA